jgi:hypothetical protein
MSKVKQNTGGNPYLNGLQFKGELPIALSNIKKHFGRFEKAGRKNIYLVNNNGSPFYVWITSAPSNLKFDSAIKGIIKEYGSYPVYVYFTRDIKTYPAMGGTYWNKIKSVYSNAPRSFKGAIMGLDEMNKEFAKQMANGIKIPLEFNRFMDLTNGVGVSIDMLLKELGGVTTKRLKVLMPALEAMIRAAK